MSLYLVCFHDEEGDGEPEGAGRGPPGPCGEKCSGEGKAWLRRAAQAGLLLHHREQLWHSKYEFVFLFFIFNSDTNKHDIVVIVKP